MIIKWRGSRLRWIGNRCQLNQVKRNECLSHGRRTKLLVGQPPDFYLQIQEAGGMTYNPMREIIASLVRCGRKPAIAGPRAACSRRIRDREMPLVKRGEAG